jgi:hypothetical protein
VVAGPDEVLQLGPVDIAVGSDGSCHPARLRNGPDAQWARAVPGPNGCPIGYSSVVDVAAWLAMSATMSAFANVVTSPS